MIKILAKSIFVALVSFLLSCSANDIIRIDSKQIAEFIMPIDSTMAYKSYYVQFMDGQQFARLLVLNELANSIHIFEYPSGKALGKMHFNLLGEDGVGKIAAFLYHSVDSFFLLNMQRQLILLNSKSKVKWRITVLNLSTEDNTPDPILTRTISPMVFYNQKIILNGLIFGLKILFLCLILI